MPQRSQLLRDHSVSSAQSQLLSALHSSTSFPSRSFSLSQIIIQTKTAQEKEKIIFHFQIQFPYLFSGSVNLWAKMQETGHTATTSSVAASSLPSSSEKSSSSALHLDVKEGPESDEEIRRVPEMGGESAGTSASRPDGGGERVQGTGESQRKRGRTPAEKESKRLKRLLRNRVSAQQARERKKAYLIDLEAKVKDLEKKNSELDERLSTLQNENQMLRHILKNTTASRRGGSGGVNEGTL